MPAPREHRWSSLLWDYLLNSELRYLASATGYRGEEVAIKRHEKVKTTEKALTSEEALTSEKALNSQHRCRGQSCRSRRMAALISISGSVWDSTYGGGASFPYGGLSS